MIGCLTENGLSTPNLGNFIGKMMPNQWIEGVAYFQTHVEMMWGFTGISGP
jgi:hypothetical protein